MHIPVEVRWISREAVDKLTISGTLKMAGLTLTIFSRSSAEGIAPWNETDTRNGQGVLLAKEL